MSLDSPENKCLEFRGWGSCCKTLAPENDAIEDDETDDGEENVEDRVEPQDVNVDIPVISPE